jgi:hypothetical protein
MSNPKSFSLSLATRIHSLEAMQTMDDPTGSCTLKITIISDSAKASRRARLMADRLAPDLRPEISLLGNVWRLEVFSNFSENDRDTVLRSDVIIVSAHGDAALPPHLKNWLQNIPENGVRPSALVALLDQEQETLPRLLTLRDYLREIARDRQIQFLSPEENWEPLNLDHGAVEFARPDSESPFAPN